VRLKTPLSNSVDFAYSVLRDRHPQAAYRSQHDWPPTSTAVEFRRSPGGGPLPMPPGFSTEMSRRMAPRTGVGPAGPRMRCNGALRAGHLVDRAPGAAFPGKTPLPMLLAVAWRSSPGTTAVNYCRTCLGPPNDGIIPADLSLANNNTTLCIIAHLSNHVIPFLVSKARFRSTAVQNARQCPPPNGRPLPGIGHLGPSVDEGGPSQCRTQAASGRRHSGPVLGRHFHEAAPSNPGGTRPPAHRGSTNSDRVLGGAVVPGAVTPASGRSRVGNPTP